MASQRRRGGGSASRCGGSAEAARELLLGAARRTLNVHEEAEAVWRERRDCRRAEWAMERSGLAHEKPAAVSSGDEQARQLRKVLEAERLRSPPAPTSG